MKGLEMGRAALALVSAVAACLGAAAAQAAGTARITVDDPTVVEGNAGVGSTALNFTVSRGGDTSGTVTIRYQTEDGSATAPDDYAAIAPTDVTFAPGQTAATVSVPVNGDVVAEEDESMSLRLAVAGTHGPSATFGSASHFPVSLNPEAVIAADINGDHRPDLIAGHRSRHDLLVLLNTTAPGAGLPSYQPADAFTMSSVIRAVTSADFNGDGRADVALGLSGAVSVVLNTTAPGASAASFGDYVDFAVGGSPYAIVAADLNGDGRPDLAVADGPGQDVSVLLNTTTPGASVASFGSPAAFTVGSFPEAIAALDVNRDGRMDLVAADYNDNTINVLLNLTVPGAATAAFGDDSVFATGSRPQAMTTLDVNGDGRADVVTANLTDSVSVLFNATAPGSSVVAFAAAGTFSPGIAPASVTAADFDGDGIADLAVANDSQDNVAVLLNRTAPGAASASFAVTPNLSPGGTPVSVAATDANSDGRQDIAVVDHFGQEAWVLLNTTTTSAAAAAFAAPATNAVGPLPRYVKIADIDTDGKPDAVTLNTGDGTVGVLLNATAPGAAAASFQAAASWATGAEPFGFDVGDLNGDGIADVVTANANTQDVSVLLGLRAPGVAVPRYDVATRFPAIEGGISVAIGDLNGDGRPDLAVGSLDSGDNVSVLLNETAPGSTTPSFAGAVNFSAGSSARAVALGDINRDGRPDVIVADRTGDQVWVLLNATPPGSAVPSFAAAIGFAVGDFPVDVDVADVNLDGSPDLALPNGGGDTISVLLNTTVPDAEAPSFAAAVNLPTGSLVRSATFTDLNADGRPDLVVANFNTASVAVLLNATTPGADTPVFAGPQSVASGAGAADPAAADVNGDGRPDLLVANYNGNSVSALLNPAVLVEIGEGFGTIADDDVADTIPDTFSFTVRTGVATNAYITSETKAISGFTGTLPLSIDNGGQYRVNGGNWTGAAGQIASGSTLAVRHVSAGTENTAKVSTVTVGGYSTEFKSVTSALDRTPAAFGFATQTGVAPGATIESDVIVPADYNTAIPIVPGPGLAYRVNGGAWQSGNGTLQPGQTLQVRHVASSTSLQYTKSYVKLGGVVGYFTTRTR